MVNLTNGEETGNEGVFCPLLNSNSYELPWLGKFSTNSVAHPGTGDSTVVVGLDDTSPVGQVMFTWPEDSSGDPVRRLD
jgi:hypothetical protein